jgi:hypothetical protein
MNTIQKNKNILLVIIFTLICLLSFKFFPTKGNFQNAFVEISFLLVLPFLYNKFILKKDIKEYGFIVGDWKKGVLLSLIGISISIIVFFIFYKNFNLADKYFLPTEFINTFSNFLFYESVLVLFSVFIFEFFFRSFIMFNFLPYIGKFSILLQWLVFLLFLYFTKSFTWAFAPYIVFSLFSGLISYKSRSVLYSIVSQFILIIIIDASAILLFIK